jgi:hypothetical protein
MKQNRRLTVNNLLTIISVVAMLMISVFTILGPVLRQADDVKGQHGKHPVSN